MKPNQQQLSRLFAEGDMQDMADSVISKLQDEARELRAEVESLRTRLALALAIIRDRGDHTYVCSQSLDPCVCGYEQLSVLAHPSSPEAPKESKP